MQGNQHKDFQSDFRHDIREKHGSTSTIVNT